MMDNIDYYSMTDQDYINFINQHQAYTLESIANKLGIVYSTVWMRNRRLGIIKKRGVLRKKCTSRKINIAEFKSLLDGYEGTDRDLAKHFGVTPVTIFNIKKKLGVKRQKAYIMLDKDNII